MGSLSERGLVGGGRRAARSGGARAGGGSLSQRGLVGGGPQGGDETARRQLDNAVDDVAATGNQGLLDRAKGIAGRVGNSIGNSLLGDALTLFDKPRAALMSTKKEIGDLFQGEGFSARDWKQQLDDNIGFGDIIEEEGFLDAVHPLFGDLLRKLNPDAAKRADEMLDNTWIKRGAGLAGDIALDPFTFVNFGTTAANGIRKSFREVAQELTARGYDDAAEAVVKARSAAVLEKEFPELAQELGVRTGISVGAGRTRDVVQGTARASLARSRATAPLLNAAAASKAGTAVAEVFETIPGLTKLRRTKGGEAKALKVQRAEREARADAAGLVDRLEARLNEMAQIHGQVDADTLRRGIESPEIRAALPTEIRVAVDEFADFFERARKQAIELGGRDIPKFEDYLPRQLADEFRASLDEGTTSLRGRRGRGQTFERQRRLVTRSTDGKPLRWLGHELPENATIDDLHRIAKEVFDDDYVDVFRTNPWEIAHAYARQVGRFTRSWRFQNALESEGLIRYFDKGAYDNQLRKADAQGRLAERMGARAEKKAAQAERTFERADAAANRADRRPGAQARQAAGAAARREGEAAELGLAEGNIERALAELDAPEGMRVFRRDAADATLDPNVKPQGVYYNLADRPDFQSPHMDAGDTDYWRDFNPTNPLELTEPKWMTYLRHPEKAAGAADARALRGPVSTGVAALKALVPESEFNRLMGMSKKELLAEAKRRWPHLEMETYSSDAYEVLEVFGAQLAREAGHDALIMRDALLPNFSEFVDLGRRLPEEAPLRQAQGELTRAEGALATAESTTASGRPLADILAEVAPVKAELDKLNKLASRVRGTDMADLEMVTPDGRKTSPLFRKKELERRVKKLANEAKASGGADPAAVTKAREGVEKAKAVVAERQVQFDAAADAAATNFETVMAAHQAKVEALTKKLAKASKREAKKLVEAQGYRARASELFEQAKTAKNVDMAEVARLEGLAEDLAADAVESGLRALDAEAYAKHLRDPEKMKKWQDMVDDGLRSTLANDPDRWALPEVADLVKRLGEWNTPQNVNKFLKAYDAALSRWKAYSLLSPGFHGRNYMGGFFNNHALAGVSNTSERRFARAMRQAIGGGTEGITDPEVRAIFEEMEGSSLFGSGNVRDLADVANSSSGRGIVEALTGIKPLVGDGGLAPTNLNNYALRTNRAAGEGVEKMLRGPLYLDRRLKGESAEAALEAVAKYHFDYAELNQRFEAQWGRRVIPFYTWARKNMPLQLEHMLAKPGAYTRYLHAKRNIELGSEEDPVVPEYFGKLLGIRTPFAVGDGYFPEMDKPGDAQNPLYFTPDLPFIGLSEQLSLQDVLSSMSPVIKTPLELVAGKQFYNDIPFSQAKREVPNTWKPLMPFLEIADGRFGMPKVDKDEDGNWVMDAAQAYKIEQAMPGLARLRRAAPSEERFQDRALTSHLSLLFGIGARTLDDAQVYGELRRRTDKVRGLTN